MCNRQQQQQKVTITLVLYYVIFKMEVEKSNGQDARKQNSKRKFRLTRRKKRKGSLGSMKHEVERERSDMLPTASVMVEESGVQAEEGAIRNGPNSNTRSRTGPSYSEDEINKSADLSSSISKMNIMNSSFESDVGGPITRLKAMELGVKNTTSASLMGTNGYGIIDKSLLAEALNTAAMCRTCKATNSRLHLKTTGSDGLAEHLYIQCSNCNTETYFDTSRKLEVSEREDNCGGRSSYDVNKRSSMASLSVGHSGLVKFCGVMNLPKPASRQAYNKSMKKVEDASVNVAEKLMNDAAKQLFDITADEESDQIERNEERKDNIAKVAVTVDGTWQKRGTHQSMVLFLSGLSGQVKFWTMRSYQWYVLNAEQGRNLTKRVKHTRIGMQSMRAHAQSTTRDQVVRWNQAEHLKYLIGPLRSMA